MHRAPVDPPRRHSTSSLRTRRTRRRGPVPIVEALGLPFLGDTKYEDQADVEGDAGVGEDDELSVANVLWDLFDSARDGDDDFTMSDIGIFNLARRRLITRVDQLWTKAGLREDPRRHQRVHADV